MTQLVAMLEDAGLLEVYTDELGRETYRLTEEGVRAGHMLAMFEGEDADLVLEALLEAEP
jgi:DNA-binding PadR family transcriptional regulator